MGGGRTFVENAIAYVPFNREVHFIYNPL
jgi:hypothetical protein